MGDRMVRGDMKNRSHLSNYIYNIEYIVELRWSAYINGFEGRSYHSKIFELKLATLC